MFVDAILSALGLRSEIPRDPAPVANVSHPQPDAVTRALSCVGRGVYRLGAGGRDPRSRIAGSRRRGADDRLRNAGAAGVRGCEHADPVERVDGFFSFDDDDFEVVGRLRWLGAWVD